MSKNRLINTKFWSDNFIIELNPLDRYLFLYFLTNEHTNIAGIYELPIRTMSFETGIEKDMLEKMIKRLEGKIYYIDGWVYIKNFEKHNYARGHSKVKIGIENAKKEIPEEILHKISKLSQNSIPHPYPIEGGCDSDSDSDSDLNFKKKIYKRKKIGDKNFYPPSLEEVVAYCKERNNTIDPEYFIDRNTANGWMVGKTKMKDWKAAIRFWEKNQEKFSKLTSRPQAQIIQCRDGTKAIMRGGEWVDADNPMVKIDLNYYPELTK